MGVSEEDDWDILESSVVVVVDPETDRVERG